MARRTKSKNKSARSSGESRSRKTTGYRGGASDAPRPRRSRAERGGGQTLHDESGLSPDVTPDTGSEEILPAGPGGNMAAEERRMLGHRGRTPAPESRRRNTEVEPEARSGPEDTPPAA